MKKKLLSILSLLLVIASVTVLVSCNNTVNDEQSTATTDSQKTEIVEATGIWTSAAYLKDTTLGTGANSIKVEIEAEGQKITLTINTDKKTLGEAMYELSLINDASFFDTVIGMKADWNKNQAYWAFYDGEAFMMVGVNEAPINEAANYRLVYTK